MPILFKIFTMHEDKIYLLLENLYLEIEKRKQLVLKTAILKKQRQKINFDWETENAIIRTALRIGK